jgi:hypothetical protein
MEALGVEDQAVPPCTPTPMFPRCLH